MKCGDRPEVILNNGEQIRYGYWRLPVHDFWSHKPLPERRFGWGFWVWSESGYGNWKYIAGSRGDDFQNEPTTEPECRDGILNCILAERKKARFKELSASEKRELKRLKRLFGDS
jgi:hypothetical protein